jgi:hypothetical protein
MPSPFDDVCCACMPREAIALLASLRVEPGLRAALTDQHAWLRWDAGNERVVQAVMPIHGAVLFRFHDGRWHRFGQTLPAFDFPGDLEYQPLAHVLFPAPVQPIPAVTPPARPVRLTLERDDRPRQTSGLMCPLKALLAWADTVPTARLAAIEGMALNGRVLLIGENMPMLDGSQRLWGRDVLIPLGYAPAPALPESALKEAAGLQDDEVLLWLPERMDVIERSRLAPLTRAGLRLAGRNQQT